LKNEQRERAVAKVGDSVSFFSFLSLAPKKMKNDSQGKSQEQRAKSTAAIKEHQKIYIITRQPAVYDD
jgi:hypothetical protein